MPGRACRCTASASMLVARDRMPGAGRRGPAPPTAHEFLSHDTSLGGVNEPPAEIVEALRRLDALTRRLRAECPWDREQDERSIVPHTVEEAYELAAAAHGDDEAKLLDELGDVLFQVHFLSLLLEERGAGSLAA